MYSSKKKDMLIAVQKIGVKWGKTTGRRTGTMILAREGKGLNCDSGMRNGGL